tara:strand:+ start:192 stop:572 length:381 start_codon:yes stop_codon:yes gene_type:complete
MTGWQSAYDDLEIKGVKITVVRTDPRMNFGDVFATLVINNKGRHSFLRGRIVNKIANSQENQTGVMVLPYGPTTKKITMLKNVELPYRITDVQLQVLFYQSSWERGMNVGGKMFDVDFSEAEVEYV